MVSDEGYINLVGRLQRRDERERLFGSRERKLKITFLFYGKGTGIRKCYGKGMGNLRLVFPGIPGII